MRKQPWSFTQPTVYRYMHMVKYTGIHIYHICSSDYRKKQHHQVSHPGAVGQANTAVGGSGPPGDKKKHPLPCRRSAKTSVHHPLLSPGGIHIPLYGAQRDSFLGPSYPPPTSPFRPRVIFNGVLSISTRHTPNTTKKGPSNNSINRRLSRNENGRRLPQVSIN